MIAPLIFSLRNNFRLAKPFGECEKLGIFAARKAKVAELVDAHDSKSCTARCEGSIPSFGTDPGLSARDLFLIACDAGCAVSIRSGSEDRIHGFHTHLSIPLFRLQLEGIDILGCQ